MQDVITVSCGALPDGTRVIGFRGEEAISKPYEIAIDLVLPSGGDDRLLEGSAGEGEALSLVFDRGDGRPPLRWHGVIGRLEMNDATPGGSLWTVHLVPRFWQLRLTRASRIFVEETVPRIIDTVLRRAGFDAGDYELRLGASYKSREHVYQCQESDFAFLSRWMEREGIYYFFEQGDDKELLIITDSAGYHKDFTGDAVRYVPDVRGAGGGSNFTRAECIDSFKLFHTRSPSRVRLADYDYNRPDLELKGESDVVSSGFGEVFTFGENFATPEEAKKLAAIRAQELVARRRVFVATGNYPFLRSGYTFDLDEHPRLALNAKYLVTSIRHEANQAAHALNVQDVLGYTSDELYRSSVQALPATTQFRPTRVTGWPRIDGVFTAIVDGPADSKYAQIDKQGRYKVRVQFDEGDLPEGKASTFVRMLQPHGGTTEGFHFPLRKGTEVLLLFLAGDPDRPVIAGVVPNTKTPSPVTSDSHTKNVIQTGGKNRFELEDAEGSQHVRLSTPTMETHIHLGAPREGFHMVHGTNGAALVSVDQNMRVKVGDVKHESVKSHVTEDFNANQTTTVTGMRKATLGAQQVTVQKETVLVYEGPRSLWAQDINIETYDRDFEANFSWPAAYTYDGKRTVKSNAGAHEITSTLLQQEVKGNFLSNVSGNYIMDVKGIISQKAHGAVDFWAMDKHSRGVIGTTSDIFVGAKSSVNLSASMTVSSGPALSLSQALAIELLASAKISIGATLALSLVDGLVLEVVGGPKVRKGTINLSTGELDIKQ